MKIDGDSMQKWFLTHGEKIVLAMVGPIALLMIVFAFIDKETIGDNESADQIRARADSARRDLEGRVEIPWNALDLTGCGPNPVEPVVLNSGSLNEPMVLDRGRPEPEYMPATDIRAKIVRGHLGIKGGKVDGAAVAGGLRGFKGAKQAAAFRVAVVTGLVPLGIQRIRYDEAFVDRKVPENHNPAQDQPEYYRCILERAEVKPGMTDDQLTWTAIGEADNEQTTDDVRDPALKAEMDRWAGVVQPDLVHPSLVEQSLVYPNARPIAAEVDATSLAEGEEPIDQWLPPRLLVDWDRETVVHPTIAAAQVEAISGAQAKPAAPATDGDEQSENVKKFAASYGYRLLRCYDFSVEPGKKYKYRVTLVLRNPNRGLEDTYLDSPKLKEGRFRSAPTSEPSGIVSSPGDAQ